MCGRTKLTASPEVLKDFLDLDALPELPLRFNIAPTQPIAVVRAPRRLELLRWGLLSAAASRKGAAGINARVETVARAPLYRDSFRKRRCLIIVDGFYEWQKQEKQRQPFLIRRKDGKPFALAGIWETATTSDGEVVDCCAVITGESRGAVVEVHDRMPLVVPREAFSRWLDPGQTALDDLLVTTPADLELTPVSTVVNSPANDDPRCIEPALPVGSLRLF